MNNKIRVTLLSRHLGDIYKQLERFRLTNLFDRIIHIGENNKKSDYIDNYNAIFIDDSFSERKDVYINCQIPVFSVDMIEVLME